MSSDVARVRVFAVVAAGAAIATALAIVVDPAPPEARAGAVALPHAALSCNACHDGEAPAKACAGCHGPHPSARAGHRALAKKGAMPCTSCHDIHGSDQGVRFGPQTVRYGVGRSVVVEGPRLPFEATVPLVPLARCTDGCHLTGGDDPIGRCTTREGTFSLCFDEHRGPLDSGPEAGVCADQHGPRLGAWEAARATEQSPLPAAASPAPRWLGAGATGAGLFGLAYAGFAGLSARRRRRRTEAEAEARAPRVTAARRLPVIDVSTCLGCYACVDACPYDVLRIDRYVAVVNRPEACCGLTLCAQRCPNGSLTMSDEAALHDHPRIGDGLETLDVPGLFLAGDVTGVPLIKSAILQGRRAVDALADSLPKKHGAPLDALIIGAGPAGISAALRARERGLSARVIEQGTVAQSIKSFPRGKLIFDQPLELPLAGKLWLERSSKEELLSKWLRIVREERLAIDEDRRFVSLVRDDTGFVIEARDEAGRSHRYRSARVVLAIGTRGTPRKLPLVVEGEIADKVFYSLADARSFAGQRALVVGLGDVAMETAIALAGQPNAVVTVAYRGGEMRRGKHKNRRELTRLVESGRVELLFETALEAIGRQAVELTVGGVRRSLGNDAVFVLIGNLPPRPLLEGLGVGFSGDPRS